MHGYKLQQQPSNYTTPKQRNSQPEYISIIPSQDRVIMLP
jgi:hypothetical protein